MKKLVLCFLISTQSFASCNWETDIKKLGGSYVYTEGCFLESGRLVNKNKELQSAIAEYKKEAESLGKTIEFKDLAIAKSEERVNNFREESYNQYDRLLKQEKMSRANDYLYFGAGIIVTALAVWGAGQLGR